MPKFGVEAKKSRHETQRHLKDDKRKRTTKPQRERERESQRHRQSQGHGRVVDDSFLTQSAPNSPLHW